MANNEIHNYVDEQITPNDTDYLDLDADQGGGNFLSKKLTFANLRKWLFKLVSQEVRSLTINNASSFAPISADTWNSYIFYFTATADKSINVSGTPYNDSATYIAHVYNETGINITLNPTFITAPDNPDITTTVGGYAQVWISYHKKSDNSEVWTANTINFI
jgi:hypothetical protein